MDINKTQIPREVESDSDSESEERYHNVVTGLQSTSLNNENQTESQSDNEKEDEPVLRIEKDISKALAAKESGNEKFRNKLYDESIQMYSYAITYCPEDEENKDNLAAFYGNRSAAYFAMEEYQLTVNDCSDSIKLKPEYVKVLMRRSQAQEKLGHLEEALAGNKLFLI